MLRIHSKPTEFPQNRTEIDKNVQCALHTEERFADFLSGGFTTMAVINSPERKLAKHTSVESSIV